MRKKDINEKQWVGFMCVSKKILVITRIYTEYYICYVSPFGHFACEMAIKKSAKERKKRRKLPNAKERNTYVYALNKGNWEIFN